MGGSTPAPAAPAAPAPIDPGKSSIDYINAMADPALQAKLLSSEQTYRPQYAALELADINTYLNGTNGQKGVLDLTDEATRRANALATQSLSDQRAADIGDVERLGGRATAAFRAADPLQNALVTRINELANRNFDATGRLSPEAQRNADQQARSAGAARGRTGDSSTIAAEILNREASMAQRRQEALQSGQMAFAANQATAADPFQAILGRPGQAQGAGMAALGGATGLAGQQAGPNLFNPDAGINLGLQQQSNQANYASNIYGAQAAYAGSSNQGRGSMIGGIAGGLGAVAGGALIVF